SGRSRRGRGVLPAADHQSTIEPRAGLAPSRGDWRHRRKRCRGGGGIGRDRTHLDRRRRRSRVRHRRRAAADAAAIGGDPSADPRQAAAGRLFNGLMAYHPFRNLGLKFVSTLVAIMLWLIVAGERVVERVMRAPVEFQNLPAGLEIVGDAPDTIEVRLRGSSGALSRMSAGDMAAVIDLTTARPGQRLFHITPGQVNVPYGV